jgi:hypothetical protein
MKEIREDLKHILLIQIRRFGGYVRIIPVGVIDGKQLSIIELYHPKRPAALSVEIEKYVLITIFCLFILFCLASGIIRGTKKGLKTTPLVLISKCGGDVKTILVAVTNGKQQ